MTLPTSDSCYDFVVTKTCRVCGETKQVEEFYAAKTRDGRDARCKECVKAASRHWASRNPEKTREYKRRWEASHRERHLEYKREQYAKIKDNPAHKDYWRAYREAHREELNAYNREYQRTHYRWVMMLRKYGLTPDAYAAMAKKQRNCCPICLRVLDEVQVHVDHCHTTGAIRGLLCQRCNQSIGLLGDDADAARRAARYLRGGREGKAS